VSELGYFEPTPGIYGTPTPGTDPDPVSRAALQEATTQAMIRRAGQPGYVPPNYAGPVSVGPSRQQTGGPSNLPKIGWTAQNSNGSPAFVEPYTADHMGQVPVWNTDGSYDTGPVVTGSFAPNPLGRAPIGDGLLQYDDTPTNPNRPPNDVGGTGELDY
jgi:hypothetical protein